MESKSLEITLRPYRLSDAEDFLKYTEDERVTQFTRWNTFKSKKEALSYIKDCRAEIGYALAAEYWGQGIVIRAVKMAITEGFNEFTDLVRMQALVLIENKASQRVLEKLGFHMEGLLREYTIHKVMESSRISLRPFKVSDADDFLKWASDDKVTRYLRWNTITSREEALAYIEKVAIPHPWRQSICLDDHSIGYVSVKPELGDDTCRAHVSYAVSAEYWGQGIAKQALRMAMSRVYKEFPCLVRVEALVEVENKGSQMVLEKVGFVKEGLLRKYGYCKGEIRDMFIYSFLSTDKIM
ncbi:hypothetical protein ACFX13_012757 [Malus domestica]